MMKKIQRCRQSHRGALVRTYTRLIDNFHQDEGKKEGGEGRMVDKEGRQGGKGAKKTRKDDGQGRNANLRKAPRCGSGSVNRE